MRSRISLAVTLLTCLALAPAATAQTAAPAAPCPTFTVLHDDRIGALTLPAGPYTITLGTPSTLTCAQAADLFRQFLQDFDGRLRGGWRVDAATSSFSRSGQSFSVAPAPPTTPATPVTIQPTSGGLCPSTFFVLHDDHIGRLELPRGSYTIRLLAHGRLTCAAAARLFSSFLLDYDGRLPGRWIVDPETGTFLRGSVNHGFRVEPTVDTPDAPPAESTTLPADGRACPGTFRVLHDDRIGSLSLAAGRYVLTPLRGSSLSCARVSSLFRDFLAAAQNALPRPWVLQRGTATFTRGRGSDVGFRVKPAS